MVPAVQDLAQKEIGILFQLLHGLCKGLELGKGLAGACTGRDPNAGIRQNRNDLFDLGRVKMVIFPVDQLDPLLFESVGHLLILGNDLRIPAKGEAPLQGVNILPDLFLLVRAQGIPVTLEELNDSYTLPFDAENAADLYLEAFDCLVEWSKEDKERLPVAGTAPLPARTEPISEPNQTLIREYLTDNNFIE